MKVTTAKHNCSFTYNALQPVLSIVEYSPREFSVGQGGAGGWANRFTGVQYSTLKEVVAETPDPKFHSGVGVQLPQGAVHLTVVGEIGRGEMEGEIEEAM